ncbi:MAG: VWA domain-containing protein [Verrucomicrobiales bacterium]|nr:VWA domain-containing protein [Verrucomicrobiales bacterium]
MLKIAERLLVADLPECTAVTARALAVWGASILFHVALVLALGHTVVFSGARVGGVSRQRVEGAQFQPYAGRFGVEEINGEKLYHIPTPLVEDLAPTAEDPPPVPVSGRADREADSPRPPRPGPSPSAPARTAGKNSFFGMRVEGKVVVFVVDVSGSMHEKTGATTRLARVFQQLEQTVWSLSAEQKFNIILFAAKTSPLSPAPIDATDENKRLASAWLAGDTDCGGTTNLEAGLILALTMKPEMIMLLTDGEADSRAEAIKLQVKLLRKRFCPAARICSVGFYLEPSGGPERLLQDLSRATDGEYLRLQKSIAENQRD